MSTIKDIELAVDIFKKNNCPFELMHSVSTYPMAVEDANLLTINSLKRYFNCKVGYSGHEDGVAVSLAAISLGISSLERHITLSRSLYGSDQAASLEPRGMKELITSLQIIIKAFGEEKLGFVTPEEKKVAIKLRAHIKQ
jgi:N-acetylneuraminate synthase